MPLSIFGYKKELRELANQLGASIGKKWEIKGIYREHKLIIIPTPRVRRIPHSTTLTFVYLELPRLLGFSGSIEFFKKAGREGIKTGNLEFDEKFRIEVKKDQEKVLKVFDPNIQFKMINLKMKKSLLSRVYMLFLPNAQKDVNTIKKHYEWELKPDLLMTGISFDLFTAENLRSVIDLMVDIEEKIERIS